MVKIFNTISGKKEPLKSKVAGKISLFVCGPTVYDVAHLGHARTYIAFDVVAKYLTQQGYKVFYLQNITDIDEKIIQRAKESNMTPLQLAKKFEVEYLKDMKMIGVNSVTRYAKATNHIAEIISQIERLIKKRCAYEIKGDGIYYDISKFTRYGKLSGRTSLQAEDSISRIDESVNKRNKGDFALFKFAEQGFAPTWESPWGKGRPGWHIEDTAITEKYFGVQYDIHGGSQDLIFPHHEAEIAQMEAISGKRPMASCWMHTGFLNVRGKKMSKSLGNFITIRDFVHEHSARPVRSKSQKTATGSSVIEKTSNGARLMRFFFLKTHYKSPMDYGHSLVKQAQAELARIDEFVDRMDRYGGKSSKEPVHLSLAAAFDERFEKAMQDDFNAPKAMAAIFDLIRKTNPLLEKNQISAKEKKEILSFLNKVDEVFGFIFWGNQKAQDVPKNIADLVSKRESFRKANRWDEADNVRQELESHGWIVQDTPRGPRAKPLKK